MFEHIVDRARLVRDVPKVVICTSTDPADDDLEHLARGKGVAVHRGSLEDKIERWLGAAAAHHVDYFVAYDGDDMFCDPELMQLAVDQMTAAPCDFLNLPQGLVVGAAAVCVSVQALRRVAAMAPHGVDHAWTYFTESGAFDVKNLDVPDPVFFDHHIRLTLDYEEDLLFFRTVFRELRIDHNRIPVRDILLFLKDRPDIAAINWFRQMDYLENQRKLTRFARPYKD